MNKNIIKIAFVVDLVHLLFVIYMLNQTSKTNFSIFVFHIDLNERARNIIRQLASSLRKEIHIIQVLDDARYFDNQHISKASFIRLQIPELIKETFLYLDLDILPRKNWDEIEINGIESRKEIVWARQEWISDNTNSKNQARILSGDKYFNAGVMVVNPYLWIRENIANDIDKILPSYGSLGFENSDQCVLNYVLKGKVGFLSPSYNRLYLEPGIISAKFVHFAGTIKPWNFSLSTYLMYVSKEFIQYGKLREVKSRAMFFAYFQ